jgi:hypothetical protein
MTIKTILNTTFSRRLDPPKLPFLWADETGHVYLRKRSRLRWDHVTDSRSIDLLIVANSGDDNDCLYRFSPARTSNDDAWVRRLQPGVTVTLSNED